MGSLDILFEFLLKGNVEELIVTEISESGHCNIL